MLQLLLTLGRLAFLVLLYYFLFLVVKGASNWIDLGGSRLHADLSVESFSGGVQLRASGGSVLEGETLSFQPPIRFGRERDNDLVFEDPFVSGHHALIERLHDSWRLTDLGSRNGTWHNGARVTGPVALAGGDTVKIGETVLRWKG